MRVRVCVSSWNLLLPEADSLPCVCGAKKREKGEIVVKKEKKEEEEEEKERKLAIHVSYCVSHNDIFLPRHKT